MLPMSDVDEIPKYYILKRTGVSANFRSFDELQASFHSLDEERGAR